MEKTLESPLDCKEIQPIHSEGDQPWDFFGRNGAKAKTPVLWPPHVKSWFIGKDSDAGKDCRQEEKGTTEDEMAGWHHWVNGHESEWIPGVGDGQGGHTVKGFGIVNKAEIDVFLELSCFSHDPADVGNLISGSSAFSKTSLNIWKFMVHVLLKPGLDNFEHYFTSVWDECNCAVVWAFFGIAFLWDWNENWPFPVLWPRLSFPYLLAYWVQHFHSIIFQDLKELNWNPITSISFVRSDAF